MVTHQGGADGQHRAIKYRPDIDGLRGIAVTSVVAYHCGLGWVRGGFVGVDVFFVISGYLIGSLVYKKIRDGSFSLAKFYARRVKRILPALFGVLLITYVAGLLLLVPLELRGLSASALAAITSSSNFFFLRHALNYFGADTSGNPLLMTWTLGVEEQFYVFFPLLMLLMRGKRWQLHVGTIGGGRCCHWRYAFGGSAHFPVFAFYMLPTRGWELGCGVLLAMIEANRRSAKSALPPFAANALSVAGVALIGLSIGALDRGRLAAGLGAVLPVVGTLLLIASREGVINRVLAWRPIVFVGLISYSWYLWHWPLLSFAQLSSSSDLSSEVAVAIGMLSFGCAALSYFFIERPFRRSTTPTKTLLWRYGGVACVMMVPAAAFFVSDGLPQRNRKAQELEAATHELERDSCQVWEPGSHLPLHAPCIPPGNGRAAVLIGDSHAAEMASPLRDIARADGYRLVELNMANCPPLGEGVARTDKDFPWLVGDCVVFNRERLDYIAKDKSIDVVIAASWWAEGLRSGQDAARYTTAGADPSTISAVQSRELLKLGLEEMVLRMRQAGKTVYLVQDNAEFAFDPARLMKTRVVGPRRALARLIASTDVRLTGDFAPEPHSQADEDGRSVVADVVAGNPDVQVIDLKSALCGSPGCRFAEGDRTLYMDEDHLTSLGARIALAEWRLP